MKAYQLGLYEKAMPSDLSWGERLTAAKNAGFDYVEISIDETDSRLSRLDWTKKQRGELADVIKETGVPLGSMCLSGHRKYPFGSRDEATRRRSMEIMEKAVTFAADLGIRTIQLAGYDVYYEDGDEGTRLRFAENLSRAVDIAAAAGIALGFETMETEFMNTVAKAMKYVNLINSPYLGVYPDLGNLTNAAKTYGTDVDSDIQTGSGHIVAMHLKETVPGVFREVPFGTGHVDFQAGIAKAWSLGVRRYVTEMWYTGGDTWKNDIAFARQKMRAILNRQGESR